MKFFARLLTIILMCSPAAGSNITNLYTGQQIYTGMLLTSVASTDGGFLADRSYFKVVTSTNNAPMIINIGDGATPTYIDWGDGNTTNSPGTSGGSPLYYTNTYATAGTYTNTIRGGALQLSFWNSPLYNQWLREILAPMYGLTNVIYIAFRDCINLTGSIPVLSHMTNMVSLYSTFYNCPLLTGQIPSLSALTNLTSLSHSFYTASSLTGNIPDISTLTKLTTLESGFRNATNLSGNYPTLSSSRTNWVNLNYAFASVPMLNNTSRVDYIFGSGDYTNLTTAFRCFEVVNPADAHLRGAASNFTSKALAPTFTIGNDLTNSSYHMFGGQTNLEDWADLSVNWTGTTNAISGVQTNIISTNEFAVIWTTVKTSTNNVLYYGFDTNCTSSVTNNAGAILHSNYVSGASSCTNYYFKVSSVSVPDGDTVTSAVGSLAMLGCPPWTDNYFPTNILGYIANGWWVAENARSSTSTNATGYVTNLPDWSGNNFMLTNVVANSEPLLTNNAINGRPALLFDGSNDWIRNQVYANALTTHGLEYVLVASFQWSDANLHYIFLDSAGGLGLYRKATTLDYQFYGGSTGTAIKTNTWAIINCSADKYGNAEVYVNTVSVGSGPGSAADTTALSLGGRYSDGAGETPMVVAEFISYQTNLSVVARSNLFSYLTNKYGVMQ